MSRRRSNKARRYNDGVKFMFPTENFGNYLQADPVFQAGTFSITDVPVVPIPDGSMTVLLLGMGTTALGWVRTKLRWDELPEWQHSQSLF
jgi:hypothetical protein